MTGYDLSNDYQGKGSAIYTYCNYLDSSYDYSTDAIEELKQQVKPHLNALKEKPMTNYFLTELNILKL